LYFIINQFSFLLVSVFLLICVTIISRQILDFKIALVFILIITSGLIFTQIFLKTKTSEITKIEDLNKSLESHKFTLIQIYSDY
jgi:ABC-type transport system involved in cytochrome bd biosynthesis fused ATPase/permease subunit